MLRARLMNGKFLMGVDAENLRRLQAGMPIYIDLRQMGGVDQIALIYGETIDAIRKELEEKLGPMPPESTWPET